MERTSSFIPQDRRIALAQGMSLPDRTTGAAMLADLSGFTALTEALTAAYGPRRGAEELTHLLNNVFDTLIGQVRLWRGAVISFAGDAITCWFDQTNGDESAIRRAATCALAMQEAMTGYASVAMPDGRAVALTLKVVIAAGPARRFLIGDPQIQLLDVIAGPTVIRLGALEDRAGRGEVLLDDGAVAALAADGIRGEERVDPESGDRLFVLTALDTPAAPMPWPEFSEEALTEEQVRPWLLPAVYERLQHGAGAFLTELRPAVPLFLHFSGIDYERPTAGTRLDTYIRWVQNVLARYEASLLQLNIGDKGSYFYAVFGAPLTHADEPARAVAAALELRTPPPNCSYVRGVQIGLSSGTMWTGAYGGTYRSTYGVLGDPVNLAARLMQSAAPGGILATREVRQATEGRFHWAALPALTVKGKAAPVPVFGLVDENGGREIGLLEPTYHTPLVGRTAELATLDSRLALAGAGQGQVVGITGEAGLGKSRLVAETVRRAHAAGWAVYAGSAQSYGLHTAYLAWQPVWHAFFDLDPDGTPDEQQMALEDTLAEIDETLLERLPLLGAVLGLTIPDTPLTAAMDPALRKASLEALLIDCLRARAAQTPRLLVLEDTHWLDPLSQDLLEAVSRAIGQRAVLLLIAYRPPEIGGADSRLHELVMRLAALPDFTELTLTGFSPAEAAELVARLQPAVVPTAAAGEGLPPEFVAELTRRAEGNPFFLEELLNFLAEREVDPQNPAALAGLEWPASLHRLLLARIDQLTEQQRTVLKVASIIGRHFERRQLWGVLPDLGTAEQVAEDLMVLDQADLAVLDMPEPEPSYLFKHIVTQEVTYASLPHELGARLHEQFAAWLESTAAAAGAPAPLDLLAYHYGQSENQAKQREYFRKAGDAAAAAYNNAAAVDYYHRLLAVLDAEESTEPRGPVLRALGSVLELIGNWPEAAERFQAALAEAEAGGDSQAAAHAALGMGGVRRRQGAWTEAAEWLDRAHAVFADRDDAVGESRALSELGALYLLQGNYERAHHILGASATRAEQANDRHGVALAVNNLGLVLYHQHEYEQARELWQRSLAMRREFNDQPGIADCLRFLAWNAWSQRDNDAALTLINESQAICRKLGDRMGIAWAVFGRGLVAGSQGRIAQSRALLEESLALFQELGERWGVARVGRDLGVLTYLDGDPAQGQARLLESLAGFRALGDRLGMAEALVGLAMVAPALTPGPAGSRQAARLGGAAAALLTASGALLEPPVQDQLDGVRAAACTALGDEAAATAWAAGAAQSADVIVAEVLGETPVSVAAT